MAILFFPLYVILIYLLGNLINSQAYGKKTLSITEVVVNLVVGFGAFMLGVHLLSFITQSLSSSNYICLALIIIGSIIYRKKINKFKIDTWGWIAVGFSLIFGFFMGMRDKHFGNPDNFHIPFTASIANNNIYPPMFPSTNDMDMGMYHYGTDLTGAILKNLFNLSIWDTQSTQSFFGVALCFLSVYALINFFTKDNKLSFILSLVVTFYTSINSLDFFFREFNNLSNTDGLQFLRTWLVMSWTSASHMCSQMRLTSQNSSFLFAFILMLLFVDSHKNQRNHLVAICIVAFGVYHTFPAFYYPIAAAMGVFLLWELYRGLKEEDKVFNSGLIAILMILAVTYLGKILTFTGGFASHHGVKTLVFSPSFTWLHWGKVYIRYFFDINYLKTLGMAFDYAHPNYYPIIPFFSFISFREFGFSGLLGLAIIIYQFSKRKLDQSCFIYFSAFISMMVPLLVAFLPRAIETTRFLHLSKISFVIFVCIHAPFFWNKISKYLKKQIKEPALNQAIKVTLSLLLIIMLIPGSINMLPVQAFIINGNNVVPEGQKKLIHALEKVHQTGKVCLDTVGFKNGHNISELAGFFGVGGQLYKADDITRKTAVKLLNPNLLQELKVDYVLIHKGDELSQKALARLKDPQLFNEIPEINQSNADYRLYEFKAKDSPISPEQQKLLEEEYAWTVGCELGRDFKFIEKAKGSGILTVRTRLEGIDARDNLRFFIKDNNPVCAFWIKEQAIIRSEQNTNG